MVDLSERVMEIKKLVDGGKYFTINRPRQYGKTTTLTALQRVLTNEYIVLNLSFARVTEENFKTEQSFVKSFCRLFKRNPTLYRSIPEQIRNQFEDYLSRKDEKAKMDELFLTLGEWCEISEKPIVLIIDEVDSATNNQVFLDFLALLRDGYISRDAENIPTFQSVILAGVTDVKHLKSKIRDDDQHKVNSPWNIAADFDIDMSLHETGIQGMLDEYKADHNLLINTAEIARQIHEYTNGYPYLVSRICEVIDQKLVPNTFTALEKAWTIYGVDEAVKFILSETGNPLFESLTGELTNHPNLKYKLRHLLLRGESIAWLPYDEDQQQLFMYGFIRNSHNTVTVSNRMFEMLLYTHFIGESDQNNDLKQIAAGMKSAFVDDDGWLDVPKMMDHFVREHNRIHKDNTEKFIEEEGRERFITYVSGIINGTGTYSVEERLRDYRRTDLIIHYLGRRYIIEMKIWHGERYNAEGEKQLSGYLDYWDLKVGYMLSFSFNKNKQPGLHQVHIGDRLLYEAVV